VGVRQLGRGDHPVTDPTIDVVEDDDPVPPDTDPVEVIP
jgi:hypothetical protein